MEDNAPEAVQAAVTDAPPSHKLRKNLLPLEHIFEDVNRILAPAPAQRDASASVEPPSIACPSPPSSSQPNAVGPADAAATEPATAAATGSDGGVEDGATSNGTSEKSERVIVLDD